MNQRIVLFHSTRDYYSVNMEILLYGNHELPDQDNSRIFDAVQTLLRRQGGFVELIVCIFYEQKSQEKYLNLKIRFPFDSSDSCIFRLIQTSINVTFRQTFTIYLHRDGHLVSGRTPGKKKSLSSPSHSFFFISFSFFCLLLYSLALLFLKFGLEVTCMNECLLKLSLGFRRTRFICSKLPCICFLCCVNYNVGEGP